MKKLISILMTLVLGFTTLSCTTVFAESYTVDVEAACLEEQIISNVAHMINKSADEIILTEFYKLSDEAAVYSYDLKSVARCSNKEQTIIGKYKYIYEDINQAYYFERSQSYTLNTAYSSGMISDEQLDKIAEFFGFEPVGEDEVLLKIREEIIKDFRNISPEDITFSYVNFLSNDDVLFAYRVENYGSYCVMNDYHIGKYRYYIDNGSEIYLYSNSEVNRIDDAYKIGVVDDEELDEIARILSEYFSIFTDSTDANNDGSTDIDDVTLVQKQIADIPTPECDYFALADVDNDGYLTINDATQIQKYIAGLKY